MVALVALETVLLALLVLLVAGLLRSHAEILRRLGSPSGSATTSPPARAAVRRQDGSPAAAIAGETSGGDAVKLTFEGGAARPTLLAFLTSGCSSCAGFWQTLGDGRLPEGVQPLIVTHGRERESPSRLRRLAPANVPLVMSSPAWDDYGVPGAPYFVLVDGHVRGEGVATAWPALASLVTDAIEDDRAEGQPRGHSRTARAEKLERTFAAAGIGPEHPSLYPSSAPAAATEPAGPT